MLDELLGRLVATATSFQSLDEEVSASPERNDAAMRLYQRMGFQRSLTKQPPSECAAIFGLEV